MNEHKTTISDPWMGTRDISDRPSHIIEDQLKLLKMFRDDGRKPSELLLQDIRIYEFILSQPDPDKSASEYMRVMNQLRDKQDTFRVKKIDAVKILGWDVE